MKLEGTFQDQNEKSTSVGKIIYHCEQLKRQYIYRVSVDRYMSLVRIASGAPILDLSTHQ